MYGHSARPSARATRRAHASSPARLTISTALGVGVYIESVTAPLGVRLSIHVHVDDRSSRDILVILTQQEEHNKLRDEMTMKAPPPTNLWLEHLKMSFHILSIKNQKQRPTVYIVLQEMKNDLLKKSGFKNVEARSLFFT